MKWILKSVLKSGQEFPGKQTNDYGKTDILFQIKNALWLFFTISLINSLLMELYYSSISVTLLDNKQAQNFNYFWEVALVFFLHKCAS